ncbi:hypothetical protein D6D13_00681 [Aureobasidium pullulans]|uniref:Uncharacterized protein n=1 Tax=Aureobasidium pullulans TaxID=5580 RepID=A0A4S9DA10_AURPU|nr:hypothetical protein D6D13_00681 [Aureobasidium pullulans]
MAEVDLKLPELIPEMARYQTNPMSIDTFALYCLVDCISELPAILEASNSEMNEIVETYKHGPQDDRVQCRTETVFGSMKEVIQHHLATCDEEKVDPHYFLVVADAEWEEKGIIAVNLDSGDPEEGGDARLKPDLFWMKIEESGLLLVNLQIANTDWYEAKENYEVVEEEPWTGETFADGAPTKKPKTDFYIGFYAVQAIDSDEIIQKVQPGPFQPPEDYCCRFEGHLERRGDLVEQATSLHRQRCLVNPYLQKDMMFVAESEDYAEKGLLMCHIPKGETKRVACVTHTLVPDFCMIAHGSKKWSDL